MSILGWIAIWVIVSVATGPFIGRFAGFNDLDKD